MTISTSLAYLSPFIVAASFMTASPCLNAADVKGNVKSVTGDVRYAGPGSSSFQPLTVGTELGAGSRVKTGAGSSAVVVVLTGTAIEVAENTEIGMESISEEGEGREAKRKALVSLKSGTVSALIDPKRSKETDFKFQTPNGVAAARGTFYAVTVQNGKTYVGVKKGRVAVVGEDK